MNVILRAPAFFLLLLASLSAVSGAAALPLQHGEQLEYRVSWAIVPGAGEIKISAENSPTAPGQLVVTSTTATRRLAKFLLPFEARAHSTFALDTGRLRSLHEKANTRGKQTEHTVTFDYTTREAMYVKLLPKEEPRILPIPPGEPVDLIMALLQTRTWDLKPGEKRDALVLFDDDFYELTLHATHYEEVRTPVGTFNTLVLEPRMEKTAPKGMFKRGSTVRVWIAQDDHRLPVKFEVEFKIGTGTATLVSYKPPVTDASTRAAAGETAPQRSSAANTNANDPRP